MTEIGKTKIVLDKAPQNRGECIMDSLLCNKLQYCWCEGGYYDSLTFDFDKCPYCIALSKTNR